LLLTEKVQGWISDPPPNYLFEITETSLASVSTRNPTAQARELLTERGLSVSPNAPNLLKPQLYREALQRVLPANGTKRLATALVLPDYAVRMALLDFEAFPSGEAERTALLRFRLRKSVPFPIDEAQVSHSVQTQTPNQVEVLAVAIARPILAEYEGLFTDSGLRLGLVVPSCLATLQLCQQEQQGLTLLMKAAGATVSVMLLERGRVRLIRCLDLTDNESQEDRSNADIVLPLLQQTIAYSEDQLGEGVGQVMLCGFGSETEAVVNAIMQELGISSAPVRSRFGTAAYDNAGLLGLLERYAA
jgi:type IV pilus assembly protein PilM